jgi:hypothetical protein
MGGNIGSNAIRSVAWSAGIALISYFWATHLYTHRPTT